MDVFWLVAQPWDYAAGAARTVRATSAELSACVLLDGVEWLPVIADGPTFSTTVFDGAAVGPSSSTGGSVELAAQLGEIDDWATLAWASRPISIYHAVLGLTVPEQPVFPTQVAALTLIFEGEVEAYDADKAAFTLSSRLPSGRVSSAAYTGVGGTFGAANIKGGLKPWASGRHLNRSPVLVDPAFQLYQVHGYGAIEELTNVRERGIVLDQARVAHAGTAALMAATVLQTEIHVCLAEGLFRLGFVPAGEITADFKGDSVGGFSARLGRIIKRLLEGVAGWPTAKIHQASLDDLDASVPHDAFCFDDSGSDVIDVISNLLNPIGAYWDVDELGVFYVGLFRRKVTEDFSVGPEGLAQHDLADLDMLPTRPPFWKNRMGWAFNPNVFDVTDVPGIETARWPGPPPLLMPIGSLYFDAEQRPFRFEGRALTFNGEALTFGGQPITTSGYVDVRDQGITAAQAAIDAAAALAQDAQATADGKVQSFYQSFAPEAEGVGDLWFDTDDGNKQYRWSGSAWLPVQDAGIGIALSDAAGAQATADGKVTTFVATSAPVAEGEGDLWWHPTARVLRRWDGDSWEPVSAAGVEDNSTRNVSRGTWSALVTDYVRGDVVAFEGASYIAVQAVPTGTVVTNTTYWSPLALGGIKPDLKFKRQNAAPATPTGDNPAGWSDGVPAGTETLWLIRGTKTSAGALIGVWTTPRAISGITPRGAYAAATAYYTLNAVTYNGGTYVAIVDTTGNAPSGTAEANAWWDVLAAPGAAGPPATPPGAFSATINLTSGAAINLRTVADAAGYTGMSDATVTFKVPNGVTIRGLSSGGRGIDTGTWPGGYTIALTLVIESGGIVDGGGGAGGSASGGDGNPGGDAIYVQHAVSGGITINSGGTVRGGGGGGGASAGYLNTPPLQQVSVDDPYVGGSGGGGGAPNGAGGSGESGQNGGADGTNGAAGTTSGGGAGAASGGTFATAGGSSSGLGGAAGFAVRKNGHAATVTNNGTMVGSAA